MIREIPLSQSAASQLCLQATQQRKKPARLHHKMLRLGELLDKSYQTARSINYYTSSVNQQTLKVVLELDAS